uniref:Uncharacterized protein n=1 Tax=Ananas comosus var. bracteatus TaxID=296719 RepID=A0A6V7NK36_ANACO|nr:unnamed protein product [Ananas comosus var. bracteatus]
MLLLRPLSTTPTNGPQLDSTTGAMRPSIGRFVTNRSPFPTPRFAGRLGRLWDELVDLSIGRSGETSLNCSAGRLRRVSDEPVDWPVAPPSKPTLFWHDFTDLLRSVSSMSIVQLSYLTLLREICDQLQIETPQCIVTPAAEGTYLAYIDLSVPRDESIVEMVRCWGGQSSTSAASEQDAARLTIKRMVEEFGLHVKDIETPQCVVTPAAEGTYLAYIDLPVPRNESIVEIVRCSGTQSSTSAASQQDAARLTTKRIVEEFDLQLKDINYDESIFHQNLYNELSTNHAVLFVRYNNLLKEYNFLKLKNAMAETDAPVG